MQYASNKRISTSSQRCLVCLQFKILNVPMSSQLAANHWNQQQAEQEERMRMKKLTLDINERQEQEDYQGMSYPSKGPLYR